MDGIKRKTSSARCCFQTGFTLIEVAFAIMILAGSLVTLLGLQSASIARAVRDRDRLQAMLIARQIISAMEAALLTDTNVLPAGVKTDKPDSLVDEFIPGAADRSHPVDPTQRFSATLDVQYWPIPGLDKVDPKAVKRVVLTVFWTDAPQDSVRVIYFVPSEESKPDDEQA